MKTKEELVKGMAEYFEIAGLVSSEAIISANWFYNKIRASIMTPRIVALLKAVGSKPDGGKRTCRSSCFFCNETVDSGWREWQCMIDGHREDDLDKFFSACPLLTADELREVTG